jgi:1,2-dihydroxy-3-keto-5-methylthiopentene dioxygenase
MSGAYFFDEPHVSVTNDDLAKFGVLTYKLDADNYEEEGKLAEICKENNYAHRSEICCSRKTLSNYDEMLGKFFTEYRNF